MGWGSPGENVRIPQQGGADFLFCPRAQNTPATPLDVVLRARDEGGRSGEGDDVGLRRGEEEEGTAEEKVDEGNNGGNGDGPGGAERSGEESEYVHGNVPCKLCACARAHRS